MFKAPVRDLQYALDVVGLPALAAGAFPEADADTVTAVLEGAAQVADEVLAPLNRIGDRSGASFADGKVTAAPGFAAAYKTYAEGGWTSLASPPEHGGQGLPKAVSLAAFEMTHAANMAFGLCPMLTEAAVEALVEHGTQAQQALYLPRLVSGEWTGCMNLTEPQAGSDLSLVRSTASPDGEGGYRLHGTKIYITWGDHDAADNIIHLVLARLPDAPPGVKGISLFLSPKFLVSAEGTIGERNAITVGGVEHKLGIHASAHLHPDLRGGQGRAHRLRQRRAGAHVHHDERRPAERGRAGRGHRRARLPAGRALRQGAPPGPLPLERRGESGRPPPLSPTCPTCAAC